MAIAVSDIIETSGDGARINDETIQPRIIVSFDQFGRIVIQGNEDESTMEMLDGLASRLEGKKQLRLRVLAGLFFGFMREFKREGMSQELIEKYHANIVLAIGGLREVLIDLSVSQFDLSRVFSFIKNDSLFCGICEDVTTVIISELAERIERELGITIERKEILLGEIEEDVPRERKDAIVHTYLVIDGSVAVDLTAGQYFKEAPDKIIVSSDDEYRPFIIQHMREIFLNADPLNAQNHFERMVAEFQRRINALIDEIQAEIVPFTASTAQSTKFITDSSAALSSAA